MGCGVGAGEGVLTGGSVNMSPPWRGVSPSTAANGSGESANMFVTVCEKRSNSSFASDRPEHEWNKAPENPLTDDSSSVLEGCQNMDRCHKQ